VVTPDVLIRRRDRVDAMNAHLHLREHGEHPRAQRASIRLAVREGSTVVFVTLTRSTRDSLELVAVVQRRGTSERR
jgi:hypothetical protein